MRRSQQATQRVLSLFLKWWEQWKECVYVCVCVGPNTCTYSNSCLNPPRLLVAYSWRAFDDTAVVAATAPQRRHCVAHRMHVRLQHAPGGPGPALPTGPMEALFLPLLEADELPCLRDWDFTSTGNKCIRRNQQVLSPYSYFLLGSVSVPVVTACPEMPD